MDDYVLEHLMDIESEAANILVEAQLQADKFTEDAKKQADANFKDAYINMVSELEKQTNKKIAELEQIHDTTLRKYEYKVEHLEKDIIQFEKYLDNLLFTN